MWITTHGVGEYRITISQQKVYMYRRAYECCANNVVLYWQVWSSEFMYS